MERYIDKSVVVAEMERRYEIYLIGSHGAFRNGKIEALRETIDFLNTLEVKEVDLEKEIERFVKSEEFQKACGTIKVTNLLAKHFFELGVRVQKEK